MKSHQARWRQDWGAPANEPTLEPDRPLVDPHHHFWPVIEGDLMPGGKYLADDWLRDLDTGHRVTTTIAVECGAAYRDDLPAAFAPIGETAFFAQQAREMPASPRMGGIIAHADLMLGVQVGEVLERHKAEGQGLLRGIRQMAASHPAAPLCLSPVEGDYYAIPAVREGAREIGQAGLIVDIWCYHPQLKSVAALARECPDTTFVIDHYGSPISTGQAGAPGDNDFADWREAITALAKIPNVNVKASGFTLAFAGGPFVSQPDQPTAANIVDYARPYFDVLMDSFGPSRTMFACNYPVEKTSAPYGTLWNAFKLLCADFSETEKDMLCRATATEIYDLGNTRE